MLPYGKKPKQDYGLEFLRIERLSQSGLDLDCGENIRMIRDPMYDDEKLRLMELISKENKKLMSKKMWNKECRKK